MPVKLCGRVLFMRDFMEENADDRHKPVMLCEVLAALQPQADGVYVDGTFGAGGYSRAVLDAANCNVIAIDRDPDAIAGGAAMVATFGDRLQLIEGRFADMASLVAPELAGSLAGVMLDIGVSSMQLDQSTRGFSFMRDGPLDMRMEQSGISAAALVNDLPEADLKRIIAVFGEERRAHAVARAIGRARKDKAITTTGELAKLVEGALGRKPGKERIHPATKTFQALRIYLNGELEQLALGLKAAEDLLQPGGRLAVVSFHSLEDRIVKQFLHARCGRVAKPSRHAPDQVLPMPSFKEISRSALTASDDEIAKNPRARSARLRVAERTPAMAHQFELANLGLAGFELGGR